MKKPLLTLLLLAALCCPSGLAYAENAVEGQTTQAANPIEQFTGKYWQTSSQTEKEAYIFGIESAITVDYFISQEEKKQSKRKRISSALSKFDQDWIKAFQDVPRKQIVDEINKWYDANPEAINRPVMDTIWYELIVPRLNNSK